MWGSLGLWELWGGMRLAGKRAELVGCCWHVARLAELCARVMFRLSIDAASKYPPMSPTGCAGVFCFSCHGEPSGDVV